MSAESPLSFPSLFASLKISTAAAMTMGMAISMEQIDSLDPAFIPPGYNAAQRAAIRRHGALQQTVFLRADVSEKYYGRIASSWPELSSASSEGPERYSGK